MRKSIDEGNPYNSSKIEASWPLIAEHERTWAKDKPELEPGESDELGVDFFIGPSEEILFIYAYLQNVKKKRGKKELGWPVSGFYEIHVSKGEDVTAAVASGDR